MNKSVVECLFMVDEGLYIRLMRVYKVDEG